ncbi:uncharacterized protein K460DRAFT_364301 [Cucurbitaria berberidis CBS 394.84]|uniref:Uncharacterized protein n=1 Tax=Cucurbitaria berberidis CBS 394.84 TaxID=1168544 RepID=A0A9P4LBG1_9PLEO|nr:uncharacterized protein K460DRAFT_364301 [Cucurbitaria berberidis CBS 394.84]KAF1848332.1 hypothetical protein K460DRAFT_364301 [Cucurbitaria berberidis CBS 394.84]
MSDVEQKTPNKTGASGATWSDAEKIAYLIVLCENEGKVDGKIAAAPIPVGRSIVSCKKLLWRLKEKHKDDIEKIKNHQPVNVAASASGEATATPEKSKTPRKRKTKAEGDSADNGDADGSPKKKAGGRKKKADVVKEEMDEDEEMLV